MKCFIFGAVAVLFLAATPAAAQVITPKGPFSGTYNNAPQPETDFYISVTDSAGKCSTIQVNARDLTQALQIASDYCPNCRAYDVTEQYKSGYKNPSAQPPAQYCPLK